MKVLQTSVCRFLFGSKFSAHLHKYQGTWLVGFKVCFIQQESASSDEVSQWVKMLASKPRDLDLILRIYIVEGKNSLAQVVL